MRCFYCDLIVVHFGHKMNGCADMNVLYKKDVKNCEKLNLVVYNFASNCKKKKSVIQTEIALYIYKVMF